MPKKFPVDKGFRGFVTDDAEFLSPSFKSEVDQYGVSALRGRGPDSRGFEKGFGAYSEDSADFLNKVEPNFQDHRGYGIKADVLTNVERNQLEDSNGSRLGPIKYGVGKK